MRNHLLALMLAAVLPSTLSAMAQDQAPKDTPAGKAGESAEPKTTPIEVAVPLGPSSAEQILDECIKKLEALTEKASLQADIQQKSNVLGFTFTAQGSYAQSPGQRLLLELTVKVGDADGTLKNVCDGHTFWNYRQVLEQRTAVKTNLEEVLESLKGEAYTELRANVLDSLGFGGVLPLARGLRELMDFPVKERVDRLGDREVYVLEGEWKPDKLRQALAPGSTGTGPLRLADYMPSRAVVYLDKKELWPYRLELHGEEVRPPRQKTLLVLEFLNVRIGNPLGDDRFVYSPPKDLEVRENTKDLLSRIGQLKQAIDKKAEEANGPPAQSGSPESPSASDVSAPAAPANPVPKGPLPR